MSDNDPAEAIDALVGDLLDAQRRGRRAECQALLEQHPEFAAELSGLLDDYQCVDERFLPLRRLAGSTAEKSEMATLGSNDTALTPPPQAGASFGDYDLLAEIARGGMGVVYRARQRSLNRVVALKMILDTSRGLSANRDRFLVEARAVARLSHPHIVPIYEVGAHDGQPYFTMELVAGGSLRDRIATLRGDGRAVASVMIQIARAVEHAHRRGILHRDLKPNNVLLDEGGQPRVTDFGLAKQLGQESDLTQSGAIVGTPSYMAPEQARAQTDLTTAVDVYGLGALMYELLTGRPPFQGSHPLDTLLAVVSSEPPRPRQLSADVDPDLETICLKCLDKDPSVRYRSADALADDLERWLGGKPIQARPVAATERLLKWSRRQPLLAGSLATVAAAIVGLLVLGGFLWQNAELRAKAVHDLDDARTKLADFDSQRQQAETKKSLAERLAGEQQRIAAQQKALADKIATEVERLEQAASTAQQKLVLAERDARRTLYAADMQLAHAAWQRGDVATATELLDRYRHPAGQEEVRGFEWHYLDRQFHGARLSWRVRGEREKNLDAVIGMAISRDARLLATVQAGNEVKLWNLADGTFNRTIAPVMMSKGVVQTNIMNVFFTDAGRRLVAVARKEFELPQLEKLLAEARTGQGKFRLQSLTDSLEVWTWELAKAGRAQVEPFDPTRLPSAFSTILVGGFFAVDGGSVLNVTAMDRSADGKLLALAVHETNVAGMFKNFTQGNAKGTESVMGGRLILWDLEKGEIRAQQKSPVMVTAVAFSSAGDAIALATSDGAVGVGKIDLAQPPRLMLGHHGLIYALRFAADGVRLASGGADGTVIVWDVAAAKEAQRLRGHAAAVSWLDLTPHGRTLVSAGMDGIVKVWDLARSGRPLVLRGHSWLVPALAFSADGSELISAETGGAVKLWAATDGRLLRELAAPKGGTGGLVFLSPQGKSMTWPAWNPGDNRIVLRRLSDGAERTIAWKDRAPLQSALSVDGRLVASVDHQSGRIGIWNAADGALLKELVGARFVAGIAFSKEGTRLAEFGSGAVVWDWQAESSRRLVDASESTSAMTFSADDKLAAVATKKSVRIWDMAMGQVRAECRAAGRTIQHLAFSPDGGRLATSGMTPGQVGFLSLWDTTNGREVFTATLPPALITAIAFSPEGRRLAAALNPLDRAASIAGRRVPGEIHVWDAAPSDESRP